MVLRVLLVLGLLGFVALAQGRASASVTTYGADTLRTGWYPNQPDLSPGLVAGGSFGQQFSASVDGSVYAQPLVADGTLLIATESNHVYGLDPATGAQQWERSLGTPWNPSDVGCADLTPEIGITGTPVVDPATNTMYLLHKTYASGTSGAAAWYADALDVGTGAERAGFPVRIRGRAANDPGSSFNATDQMQRPGLLLLNGVVYAGFGGHCDFSPYKGWIVGISTAGQVTTLFDTVPGTQNGAGVWQAGSGLVSDGPGSILFSTGNGDAPTSPTPGTTPPAGLGEAVVRVAVQPDGSLKATDFFAPYDGTTLDGWDADLGSGGPAALPASFGTTAHPHLMVEVGKQGYVYLLDRDNLGGMGQGPSGGDAVLSRVGPDGGVWGRPSVWPGDGGYVYIVTASAGSTSYGTAGALHAYKYGLDGSGSPVLSLAGQAADGFGLSSSSAVVSSDGTAAGSALVWVVYAPDGSGAGAQLRAYQPVPVNGALQLVKSWPIGTSSKFNPPSVDGNRVYVGTRDGHVLGFGSPATTPLQSAPVSWPVTTVGQSSVRTVTLTATADLTVSSLSTSSDFAAGAPSPPLPARLRAGQTLSVPVSFTPSVVGQESGSLTASTSLGAASVALNGTGQAVDGHLSVSPTVVSFGGVASGGSTTGNITFSNTGAQPVTVQSVAVPTTPFTVSGLPAVGAVLAPGTSVTATATFAPTHTGTFTDVVTLDSDVGQVSVPLSGSAAQPAHLVIAPKALAAGAVPTGDTTTVSFSVANTGGSPLTVTRSKPPVAGAGFTATSSLAEGTTLPAGVAVTETVAFTPTRTGPLSDVWSIAADDGSGVQTVRFSGTGMTRVSVPAPGAGGWTLNGTSTLAGGGLQLTDATTTGSAGSAYWPSPVPSSYVAVSFDAAIDAGSGADGLTLSLADPAAGARPTTLGANGGGLGWSGTPGVALALDTHQNGTDPSENFVGLATGASASNPDDLVWQTTSTAVPSLRGTIRHVRVVVSGGVLTADVDGARVLSTTVALGPQVLVGFTAGDGYLTDRHAVSNVAITTTAPAAPAPVTLSVSDAVAAQPTSGTATATFTVGLSRPAAGPVTLTYRTADGLARAGTDYVALPPTTVTLKAGATTLPVPVTVRSTGLHGTGVRDLHLLVSAVTGGSVADADGVGRLLQVRGPVSVSAGDVTVRPSATVPTTVLVPLTLSSAPAPGEQTTVVVRTQDGTATSATGAYTAVPPTTVTFGSGQATASVPVRVGATRTHKQRGFSLLLTTPSANAVVADGTAAVTIAGSAPGPGPAVSVSDAVVVRPASGDVQALFTVSLPTPAAAAVSLTYHTVAGSAAAGTDYVATPATSLTIPAGSTSQVVSVPVHGTALHGFGVTTFHLQLSGVSGAPVADADGVARLVPTTGPLSVSAGDVGISASSVGATVVEVPVTLSGPVATGETVSVLVTTSDGTATSASGDYTALPPTRLTFPAGARTAMVSVPVGAARAGAVRERFALVLSSPSAGAIVADPSSSVTIYPP